MQELISGTRECRLYLYIKTLIVTLAYWYKYIINNRLQCIALFTTGLKKEISNPVIKVKVIKVIKVSGEKYFPIVYINNYLYIL